MTTYYTKLKNGSLVVRPMAYIRDGPLTNCNTLGNRVPDPFNFIPSLMCDIHKHGNVVRVDS